MELKREKNAHPLYLQLKDIIKNEIHSGIYKTGDIIPTELEYQKKYNISRITVRQSINSLVQEGYLKRKRGKGTIVQPPKIEEPLIRIKSFTNEMKERGIKPSTKLAEISITKAFNEVSKMLGLNDGDEVYRIRRVRCANNEPIVLFNTYIKRDMDLDLDNRIYYDSLYKYLECKKGIKINRIIQRIGATAAVEALSDYLDINIGDPLLVVKRQSFDINGSIVEFTIGYYIANRYEYYIEMKGGDSFD